MRERVCVCVCDFSTQAHIYIFTHTSTRILSLKWTLWRKPSSGVFLVHTRAAIMWKHTCMHTYKHEYIHSVRNGAFRESQVQGPSCICKQQLWRCNRPLHNGDQFRQSKFCAVLEQVRLFCFFCVCMCVYVHICVGVFVCLHLATIRSKEVTVKMQSTTSLRRSI